MLIYFLVVLLLILLIGSWFLFKKDIIQPSVIFVGMYFVSTLCCVLNVNKWGVDMQWNTFFLLLIGAIHFVGISYGIKYLFDRKYGNVKVEEKNAEKKDKTNKKYLISTTLVLAIYNIIVIGLLVYNVNIIASKYGEFNSFSEMLTIYKDKTAYNKVDELPDYLTVMMKPIIASAYIFLFVFCKKIVTSKEKKKAVLKNLYMLIFPITYFIQRICESNRGSIMNFIASAFVMYILLWYIQNNWKKTVRLKNIGISLVCAMVLLTIFYFSASLIGRINTKGMVDYITFYLGGSIECLNLRLNEEYIPDRNVPATFANTIRDLNKLKITNIDIKYNSWEEFKYNGETMIGNIYTGYSNLIFDFGVVGVILFQTIIAVFFSIVYYIVKYIQIKDLYKNIIMIIYTYLIYTIVTHPMVPTFFEETFTIATIGVLMFFILIYTIVHPYQVKEEIGNIKSKLEKRKE